MLMKYKDFKTMSQNEMKQILGGNEPAINNCNAACDSGCTFSGGGDGTCSKPKSGPNEGKCFCVAAGAGD